MQDALGGKAIHAALRSLANTCSRRVIRSWVSTCLRGAMSACCGWSFGGVGRCLCCDIRPCFLEGSCQPSDDLAVATSSIADMTTPVAV
jgi:hypothetical protein